MRSGGNKADVSGWWELNGDKSHSSLTVDVEGENNSELMERFGITSGIQKAPFALEAQLGWDGSPWGIKMDTLDGNVKTKFGKGIISDVSGAARLLGLFSLDSIIRKMQLDFSDVFDKGKTVDVYQVFYNKHFLFCIVWEVFLDYLLFLKEVIHNMS